VWIFLSDSFVSIVAPQPGRGVDPQRFLIVRARVRGDIEKLFPLAKVMADAGTDYRFRAVVERDLVAKRIAGLVEDIGYTNFKDTVKAQVRHDAYLHVWQIMANLQDRLFRRPRD
jgi:hypothetical protein